MSWKSLFISENKLRCDRCDDLYRINLNYKIYELQNGIIDLYKMFEKSHKFSSFAYIYELGSLFNMILKRYEIPFSETIILFYDNQIELLNDIYYIDEVFNITDKIVALSLF